MIYRSPLCQNLVDRIPKTIAPNSITVAAFGFVLLSHILLVLYSPDLK